MFISWMVTLSSYLIWQIISFMNMAVFTLEQRWEILRQIDLQKMPILAKKNHLLRWTSCWSWRVCKQAKLSHLGNRNPHAYIENPTQPKRVTGIGSRGIIGPFFFANEQGDSVKANGARYRAMLNEFLFTKIEDEDIGYIWFQEEAADFDPDA